MKAKRNTLLKAKVERSTEMKQKRETEELRNSILNKITMKIRFVMHLRNRNQNKEELTKALAILSSKKELVVKGF